MTALIYAALFVVGMMLFNFTGKEARFTLGVALESAVVLVLFGVGISGYALEAWGVYLLCALIAAPFMWVSVSRDQITGNRSMAVRLALTASFSLGWIVALSMWVDGLWD